MASERYFHVGSTEIGFTSIGSTKLKLFAKWFTDTFQIFFAIFNFQTNFGRREILGPAKCTELGRPGRISRWREIKKKKNG
jgi:hypothetical protein